MNFDYIKSELEQEDNNLKVPSSISELKKSEMPIQKIRKKMKSEIITQLLCIVIFFAAPSVLKLESLQRAIYFIFMFLTAIMTLGYLIKMAWFLQKTKEIQSSTKDSIMTFIHDIQLTLEVYKTAIIGGSLLLPISISALAFGIEGRNNEFFEKWFLLDISALSIIGLIVVYLIIALGIYIITVEWTKTLYGKHIDQLKKLLDSLNS